MPDALITTTVVPTPPGIYAIIQTGSIVAPTAQGVIAIVGKASTGPLGVAQVLGSPGAVAQLYGPASSTDRTNTTSTIANLAREAGLGGSIQFVCVRPGAGGVAATLSVTDSNGATVGQLAHPYPGAFGSTLTVTIRAVAGNASLKELVVFNSAGVAIQDTRFAAGGGDEAGALATASSGQPYVVFTKSATGTGVLTSTIVGASLAGGTDPTVANADYTNAFALLSPIAWAVLITDQETTAMFAAISAYVNTEATIGHLRMACVAEPTSVSLVTRYADAAAINNPLVRYMGNGFTFPNGDGTLRNDEGYLASAYDGGVMSTLGPGEPMTWRPVFGATSLVIGTLPLDKATAIINGMGYYEFSQVSGIRTGAGIDTLVNPNLAPVWAQGLNSGWSHVEHVATAWGLITAIDQAWQTSIANPDPRQRPGNTPAGRAALAALASRVLKQYGDNGWIQPGATCTVDPARPPTSNIAYFVIQGLTVALRAERLVLSLPFGTP